MPNKLEEPIKTWDSTALLLLFAALNWIAGWLAAIIFAYYAAPKKPFESWDTQLSIVAVVLFLESSSVAVLLTVVAKAGRNAFAAAANSHLLASQIGDLDGRMQRLERDHEQ